jgi:hypothetical protein
MRRRSFLLDTSTGFSFEAQGGFAESLASSYNGPLPLIHALRALFWASGLGGVAVAGFFAVGMASKPRPAPSAPLPPVVQGGRDWHYTTPTSGRIRFVDRSSTPRTITSGAGGEPEIVDDSPRQPPFDISLYNDPDYLRNIEQLYNPWLGQ